MTNNLFLLLLVEKTNRPYIALPNETEMYDFATKYGFLERVYEGKIERYKVTPKGEKYIKLLKEARPVKEFLTGRNYGKEQVIEYRIIGMENYHCESFHDEYRILTIAFRDQVRAIEGIVTVAKVYNQRTTELLEKGILRAYDAGSYELYSNDHIWS